MRLIFYSGGTGKQNRNLDLELRRFIGTRGKITYIPSDSSGGPQWFSLFKREKQRLGLKHHFWFPVDRPFTKDELKRALGSDAIFLSGGNTFYFLKHLRRAGLISQLRSYVKSGGVLFGLSAGSIIMCRSIELAGLVPGEADENAVGLKNLRGLNLVNFHVFPHFRPESVARNYLGDHTAATQEVVYTIPDGSGIIIENSKITFSGNVACFANGWEFKVI